MLGPGVRAVCQAGKQSFGFPVLFSVVEPLRHLQDDKQKIIECILEQFHYQRKGNHRSNNVGDLKIEETHTCQQSSRKQENSKPLCQ